MSEGAGSTARGSRRASCHRPLASPEEPASPGGCVDSGAGLWSLEPHSYSALLSEPPFPRWERGGDQRGYPRLGKALGTQQAALHHRHLPPGPHTGPPPSAIEPSPSRCRPAQKPGAHAGAHLGSFELNYVARSVLSRAQ